MSFIDITDPKKRDVIVAEYLSTMKRIQNRNIDERIQDLVHKEQLEDLYDDYPMIIPNESRYIESLRYGDYGLGQPRLARTQPNRFNYCDN